MNKDKRIAVLINKGFDQLTAKYIMDLVDENLKNEQKEKYKSVVLEFKFRVIYLFYGHKHYNEKKDLFENISDFEFITNIIHNKYDYKYFNIFLEEYLYSAIKQINNYFNIHNTEYARKYNNINYSSSIELVSWLTQPVRLYKSQVQFFDLIDSEYGLPGYEYLPTLYYNINDQIEKQGFYKYDPDFAWFSFYKNLTLED
jgi:hypothetical protein